MSLLLPCDPHRLTQGQTHLMYRGSGFPSLPPLIAHLHPSYLFIPWHRPSIMRLDVVHYSLHIHPFTAAHVLSICSCPFGLGLVSYSPVLWHTFIHPSTHHPMHSYTSIPWHHVRNHINPIHSLRLSITFIHIVPSACAPVHCFRIIFRITPSHIILNIPFAVYTTA